MGTTAYGGKGSKGRAANGDRPVGAASCRRDHHTMASCQTPPPQLWLLQAPVRKGLCVAPPCSGPPNLSGRGPMTAGVVWPQSTPGFVCGPTWGTGFPSDALERPYAAGGGGVPGRHPLPLRMFEADGQNFVLAPPVPRGFTLQNFRPAFGGDHRRTLGRWGAQPTPPPPPLVQTPPATLSPPSNTSLGFPPPLSVVHIQDDAGNSTMPSNPDKQVFPHPHPHPSPPVPPPPPPPPPPPQPSRAGGGPG